MIRSTCIALLVLAGTAFAQESTLTLLGERPAVRPPRQAVRVPLTDHETRVVTLLARVIAAEMGPDPEAPLETRVAVGAAALRLVHELTGVDDFDANGLLAARKAYPSLCAQDYDELSRRSREWLMTNGYDLSVAAAQKAYLEKLDTSGGAKLWSDLLSDPMRELQLRHVTVSLPTSRGNVEFYR